MLSVIFVTTFILILYFLFRKKPFEFSPVENAYYYPSSHDRFQSRNIPISTQIKVIPIPQFISTQDAVLKISNDFQIISKQNTVRDLELAIRRYSNYISSLTGLSIENSQKYSSSENKLIIDCLLKDADEYSYPKIDEDESYVLNVTRTGTYLGALTLTGILRGLSTFVQLIECSNSSNISYIPIVNITDRPRFPWRGLMLDVSRHWMPASVIERTLNAMELSKLNVLHLHLSDDQGFRVESIQYKLLHDEKDFFTQKDIRYLVEYARQRRIRIVPEFDIPGHTTSWFVGYPELATDPGPYQISTNWGVLKSTMDPTKETTYKFLDVFFEEMTKLFPDLYFHIGGDEVEGTHWAQSPTIQKFIFDNKLRNKNGLQAYFNKRVQALLKKYGKIMIGWEEILDEIDENLIINSDAVIQSWKSRQATVNAVKRGFRSILSNGYYLDQLSPSMNHYTVDPIQKHEALLLNREQQQRILGGEACMWSEFASQYTVDSRIWPRVSAIAERLWSSPLIINQNFLYERLFRMSHLLEQMKTGVTHLSSYMNKLENLLLGQTNKTALLHPFVILADASEPLGHGERSQLTRYTSSVPLTTFADALHSESESIWKLENLQINDKRLHDIFQTWSLNHLRLSTLFNSIKKYQYDNIWGQNIERLSENLAHVGRIGLRVFNYNSQKVLHHDKNNTMNSWTLPHWISHHSILLEQLENGVKEVRLAAVRPVRRLLHSIQSTNQLRVQEATRDILVPSANF
ncbi:unnamed protein product [Rotaria socialis]|nr:unnamed protein product [Rotaria socialis]CAF4134777.1 unnamed protein product [Rotaria socialis]